MFMILSIFFKSLQISKNSIGFTIRPDYFSYRLTYRNVNNYIITKHFQRKSLTILNIVYKLF